MTISNYVLPEVLGKEFDPHKKQTTYLNNIKEEEKINKEGNDIIEENRIGKRRIKRRKKRNKIQSELK